MCCIYDLDALFIFCNNLSDVTGFFLGAVTYHYVEACRDQVAILWESLSNV